MPSSKHSFQTSVLDSSSSSRVKSTMWIRWNCCLWFTTLFYQQGISLSSSSPVQICFYKHGERLQNWALFKQYLNLKCLKEAYYDTKSIQAHKHTHWPLLILLMVGRNSQLKADLLQVPFLWSKLMTSNEGSLYHTLGASSWSNKNTFQNYGCMVILRAKDLCLLGCKNCVNW